ncbi:hypothetical protein [Priestia aryabhattai]
MEQIMQMDLFADTNIFEEVTVKNVIEATITKSTTAASQYGKRAIVKMFIDMGDTLEVNYGGVIKKAVVKGLGWNAGNENTKYRATPEREGADSIIINFEGDNQNVIISQSIIVSHYPKQKEVMVSTIN